jgi:hypothetical protein
MQGAEGVQPAENFDEAIQFAGRVGGSLSELLGLVGLVPGFRVFQGLFESFSYYVMGFQ